MKRLVVLATIAFFIAAAASCQTDQPLVRTGKPTIEFAGDSITVQATPDINAFFGSTHDVGIKAITGIDTFLLASTVATQAADVPDVEVINLGTNDAARVGVPVYRTLNGQQVLVEPAQTVGNDTARLDAFNAEFPNSCVVFVTVNTHNPTWGPTNAALINDHIRTTFAHVADWDAAYSASYFDTADDPHPNATGRAAMLALEDAAIATCP